ncbi:hypothetical protein PR048_028161 [Dryococelus australis]|uniref:Uncharacterized protein n=1 Tax=Dryococelus australis TaxID=614101 RepID=A0ABQ9GIF0_9NEOP|nr:hypothetical protein PR048_028161 [Dryococelus australis]
MLFEVCLLWRLDRWHQDTTPLYYSVVWPVGCHRVKDIFTVFYSWIAQRKHIGLRRRSPCFTLVKIRVDAARIEPDLLRRAAKSVATRVPIPLVQRAGTLTTRRFKQETTAKALTQQRAQQPSTCYFQTFQVSRLVISPRRKREVTEETRLPAVSSGAISTCENPGATPLGFEPGSPRWEVSSLTTTPPVLPIAVGWRGYHTIRESRTRGWKEGRDAAAKKATGRTTVSRAAFAAIVTPLAAASLHRLPPTVDSDALAPRVKAHFILSESKEQPGVSRAIRIGPGEEKNGKYSFFLLAKRCPPPPTTILSWPRHSSSCRTRDVSKTSNPAVTCPLVVSLTLRPSAATHNNEPIGWCNHARRKAGQEEKKNTPVCVDGMEMSLFAYGRRDSTWLPNAPIDCSMLVFSAEDMSIPDGLQPRGGEVLRADEGEMRREWISAGMQGRGKREIPEKALRPTALSDMIPICENSRVEEVWVALNNEVLRADVGEARVDFKSAHFTENRLCLPFLWRNPLLPTKEGELPENRKEPWRGGVPVMRNRDSRNLLVERDSSPRREREGKEEGKAGDEYLDTGQSSNRELGEEWIAGRKTSLPYERSKRSPRSYSSEDAFLTAEIPTKVVSQFAGRVLSRPLLTSQLGGESARGRPMRVIDLNMERRRNEEAGENGRSPRKPAEQRHRPVRFPLAKIRRPGRVLSPVRLGGTSRLTAQPPWPPARLRVHSVLTLAPSLAAMLFSSLTSNILTYFFCF